VQYLLAWVCAVPFWQAPLIAAIKLSELDMAPVPEVILRNAAVLALLSALAFSLPALISRVPAEAFVMQSVVGLFFSLFAGLRDTLPRVVGSDVADFTAYACLLLAVLFLAFRRVAGLGERMRPFLGIMAAFLAVVAGGVTVSAYRLKHIDASTGRTLAGIPVSPDIRLRPANAPDVYHIVLDGFGRPSELYRRHKVDVRAVATMFREKGFDVIPDAIANYDQTYLSLASMLNMNYVNVLERSLRDRASKVPLHTLIQNNSVAAALKSVGYRVVVIGADYAATQDVTIADVCDCPPAVFGEFEAALMGMTPFATSGLAGLDYIPHRQRIRHTLEALQNFEPGVSPTFLLAHLLAPHQPFVIGEDGGSVTPPRAFSFGAGVHFGGTPEEFARGYEAQARFLGLRIGILAEQWIAKSRARGRDAVIIVHGDHNTRFTGNTFLPTAEEGYDLLPILLAIRWGGTNVVPRPVTSLVNVYREFFRQYYGASLEHLPDRGFVSSYATPYRFLDVH
jgi:hypothetical protein